MAAGRRRVSVFDNNGVMKRAGVILMGVVAALTLGSVAARAVSDGQYDSSRQHCSGSADDSEDPTRVEPGCQSFTVNLSDGAGNESWFGFQQTAEGERVDPTKPVYGSTGTYDPTTGMHLYFGADDNLDNGEHDSSPLISNGPSDGGGIQLNADPNSVDPWSAALQGGDVAYLLTHPLPLVDFGMGMCADGICGAVTTQERVAYQGGNPDEPSQPVADYTGKQWDPKSCGGPDDTAADCGGHDITYWHNLDGARTTEPGVQVYEDPDPQGSPIGPYPLDAAYVGTCGVVLGGGPLTGGNQTIVPTGC
jgi:hypothetical protein